MSVTLFGVVIRETSGKPGWYDVGCSQFAGEVSGVSIKGTSLTAGQRVAIIQSGGWSDQRRTFGFSEADAGLLSTVEATITKNWLLDTNPVNGFLHYIFSKAGKAQEIYHPAIVTAVGATTLAVKDWYTGEAIGAWPIVSGLSASDFTVGDGVLLRLIPNVLRRVEGWWETYPGETAPGFTFTTGSIATPYTFFKYNFRTKTFSTLSAESISEAYTALVELKKTLPYQMSAYAPGGVPKTLYHHYATSSVSIPEPGGTWGLIGTSARVVSSENLEGAFSDGTLVMQYSGSPLTLETNWYYLFLFDRGTPGRIAGHTVTPDLNVTWQWDGVS